MKHWHMKKYDICNKLHRTCVSTYTLCCSCILHIKACFVWHDGNCTVLTYIKFWNHYIYIKFHIYICVKIPSHVCFTVVLCNKRHCSKIAVLLLHALVLYFLCGSPQKKNTIPCALRAPKISETVTYIHLFRIMLDYSIKTQTFRKYACFHLQVI